MQKEIITISTVVNSTLETVWNSWTKPEHITKWNFASDDWHCPKAENEIKDGGRFSFNMAAKDGSFAFDFAGFYDKVEEQKYISYFLGNRKVEILFNQTDKGVEVIEKFETEDQNSAEMQKKGWLSILNNFKTYTEKL